MDLRGVIDWLVDHFRLVMIILWGCTIACLVGAFCVTTFTDKPQVQTLLDLNVMPVQAKITVDGEEFQRGMSVVEPGIKHIEISADDFKSKTLDVAVEKDKTTSVSTYLLHETEGLAYYERSKSFVDSLRTVKGDDTVTEFVKQFDHKYSIYRQLPMEAKMRVDGAMISTSITDGRFKDGCNQAFCVVLKKLHSLSNNTAYSVALNYLADKGYNLGAYKVFYEE